MTTKKPDAMSEALDFLGKVVRAPEDYPDRFVAIPRNSPLLTKLFSKEPNRILDYLHKHGHVDAIQELADALGRNKSGVSRDVQLLIDVGLVSATRKGKEKSVQPTEKVVLVH